MARSKTASLLVAVTLLALFATSQAQLSDLPDISTVTDVLGATTAKSMDTAGTSRSATATSDASSNTGTATTTQASHLGGITDAPSLYGVGVPPLIVPDTSGAPFMKKSNLPVGFVFICVGVTLGFLGAIVLAWRGLVAWSLSRSVKRTASDRYISEKKSTFGSSTVYSSLNESEDVSMDDLALKDTAYKGSTGQQTQSKSYNKPPQRASRPPTNSNLFFSPTAGSAQNTGNRTSTYLPAGYYASSGSTVAAGSSMASFGGPAAGGYGRIGSSDDVTTTASVRPTSYARNASGDRQSALSLPQQREHKRKSRNLRPSSQLPTVRAPSAMLDDLFEHHTGMR